MTNNAIKLINTLLEWVKVRMTTLDVGFIRSTFWNKKREEKKITEIMFKALKHSFNHSPHQECVEKK